MRSLIRERRQVPWVPILVALFQLVLVTWIPVADAMHHCGDHPVAAGEPGGGHGDGSGLAPVCFVCAAGLGAFASASPDPAPATCTGGTPTFEAPRRDFPPTPPISRRQARAPPSI